MAAKWVRRLYVLGRPAIQNANRRKDKIGISSIVASATQPVRPWHGHYLPSPCRLII